jgi:hypothetical protein
MAKEQLNCSQVGACLEQVNRERMTQRMRTDGLGDAGAEARYPAGMLNGMRGDWSGEITGKEPILRPRYPPVTA